jgi:hypothetical protein
MTEEPTPRRRGRPRAEPSVSVTVRVPVPLFDAYCQLAIRRRLSLSQVLRELMERHAPPTTSTPDEMATRTRARMRHFLS